MGSRITSGKLIALGTVIDGAAAAAAIAIWQLHPHHTTRLLGFWIAVGAFVIGLLLVLVAMYMRDNSSGGTLSQSQQAGDESTQYMAGGDMRVEPAEGLDR